MTAVNTPDPDYESVFTDLPHPTLLLDRDVRVVAANTAARRELGSDLLGAGCCELLGCEGSCVSRAALERGVPVCGTGTRGEIIAAPLRSGHGVIAQLPPALMSAHDGRPAPLHVRVLGTTRFTRAGHDLGGSWVGQRPGLLFKYLVCAGDRHVASEELLDALWPRMGRSGIGAVRQTVHVLRGHLEGGAPRGERAATILSTSGGYALDRSACIIDADEFERRAGEALDLAGRPPVSRATEALRDAAERYTGDFLADTPYADWALAERDRLRSLATRVLGLLADLDAEAGRLGAATQALHRLAALEPLDIEVQRELLVVLLRRGREAEAARHYDAVRARYRRAFGREPGFTLADLPSGARPAVPDRRS